MDAEKTTDAEPAHETGAKPSASSRWANLFRKSGATSKEKSPQGNLSSDEEDNEKSRVGKWSFGVLNDKETDEVPGSVLLMSKAFKRNEPLGLRSAPARTSASSLPSPYAPPESSSRASSHTVGPNQTPPVKTPTSASRPNQIPPVKTPTGASRPNSARTPRPGLMRMFSGASRRSVEEKKKTADGKIILEPQPEDTLNDPLNWPAWRRDVALLSLGFYCAWGGGMTPVLAAAFNDVAATYDVSIQSVALTTGFYMCGLAIGSVIASPTAILIGKRPVYMVGALLYIISSIWCALSSSYASLVVARIFMGLAISPVECLPSATIAEIFYLHERAYRLGMYTLLLLGGKNLIPLISAAISNSLGWRWIFWFIAIMGVLCFILLFLFVPETFWDRTPRAKSRVRKHHLGSLGHFFAHGHHHHHEKKSGQPAPAFTEGTQLPTGNIDLAEDPNAGTIAQRRKKTLHHVGFAEPQENAEPVRPVTDPVSPTIVKIDTSDTQEASGEIVKPSQKDSNTPETSQQHSGDVVGSNGEAMSNSSTIGPHDNDTKLEAHDLPYHMSKESESGVRDVEAIVHSHPVTPDAHGSGTSTPTSSIPNDTYTQQLRYAPPKTYLDTLKPWNGRLRKDKWWKAAVRPFILFAYPAILWSTLIYSLSIGWLIVISEAIATIYRDKESYNFSALQCGLVYLSPFIGGVLGTAVAGKLSDIIVRWMSRRNDGVYEPEFRLVMGIPILISTSIGLMGFGWSAEEKDNFMVPTVMFGILSFGCALGSTTSITFAVDSYRQYAGEALVTLNFSKNFLHGFIFSLFFPEWMKAKGPKSTFLVIGGIQIACVLTTIPMFIYGKRARMWTVRKNMMERF